VIAVGLPHHVTHKRATDGELFSTHSKIVSYLRFNRSKWEMSAPSPNFPQQCDTLRTTAIESALEELRQDRQLPHACRTHVPFIIFKGYREPKT